MPICNTLLIDLNYCVPRAYVYNALYFIICTVCIKKIIKLIHNIHSKYYLTHAKLYNMIVILLAYAIHNEKYNRVH